MGERKASGPDGTQRPSTPLTFEAVADLRYKVTALKSVMAYRDPDRQREAERIVERIEALLCELEDATT